MLSLCFTVLLVSAVMVAIGLRGRVIGDDPHCRACGFNLRGRDPSSSRCSECGAELTRDAIRIGARRRHSTLLGIGIGLMLIAVAGVALAGWTWGKSYDWVQWKPTTWLLEDVEKTSGADYAAAVKELTSRLGDPGMPQSKADVIINRALAHQADHKAKFDNNWLRLIEAAAAAKRLSSEQAKRYLENCMVSSLAARPKLRRGQYFQVELHFTPERAVSNRQLRGGFQTNGLMLDSAVIDKHFASGNGLGKNDEFYGTNLYAGTQLNEKAISGLADGKHQLATTVTATIQQNAPFPAGPVTINVPLTTPVETFPKDAIIDEFKTDPSQRDAVRAAVVAARVFHARDKSLNVRVKTAAAPVSLAMKIVVKQAGRENDAGSILVEMGKAPRWYPTYAYRARDLHGTVDVILRPDQSAADMQRNLGTYWGEEIVIAGVQIDAPYDVPFNRDESLRADVEKSVQLTQITRTPGDPRLGLSINFRSPPVKLVYYGFLRIGTHEVAANPDYGAWVVPSKQNYGFGTGSPEVDPSGQATKCDLILRPDPDWEARSQDLIPPWGGEVVIHDVPIVTTKAAADKK